VFSLVKSTEIIWWDICQFIIKDSLGCQRFLKGQSTYPRKPKSLDKHARSWSDGVKRLTFHSIGREAMFSSGGPWSAAAVGHGLQQQLFILSTSAII